jgi:PEP-CTERM motif
MNLRKLCFTATFVAIAGCYLGASAKAELIGWSIDSSKSSLKLAFVDSAVNLDGTIATIRLRNQSGGNGGPWNVGNVAPIAGTLWSNYVEIGPHSIEFLSAPGFMNGVNSGSYRPNPAALNPASTNAENPNGQYVNTTTAAAVFGVRARASVSILTVDAAQLAIRNVNYDMTSGVVGVTGSSGGTFAASLTSFGILSSVIDVDGFSIIIVGQPIPDGPIPLNNLIAGNTAGAATITDLGGLSRSLSIPIAIPFAIPVDDDPTHDIVGTATGTIFATAIVPEPSTLALSMLGLGLFVPWWARRRKRN